MTIFEEMIKSATEFMQRQKGSWDHAAWSNFLSTVQKAELEVTEETISYLGEVLESLKKIYFSLPAAALEQRKELKEKPQKPPRKKAVKGKITRAVKKAPAKEKINPLKSGRLFRKFLMELDEGLYLVSNVKDTEGKPVIAEEVTLLSERDKQWKRITDTAAKYKTCYIFKDKKDYEASHGQRGKKVQRKSLKVV